VTLLLLLVLAAFSQGQEAGAANPDQMSRECAAGHARSCSILGTLYYNGTGVPADEAKAQTLLRGACDAGDPQRGVPHSAS
jgi:TPR repeat protein